MHSALRKTYAWPVYAATILAWTSFGQRVPHGFESLKGSNYQSVNPASYA
ncbi:hypothetical protein RSAG8_07660, partial [Rhizoctonia solani AG-8 WAC10335]